MPKRGRPKGTGYDDAGFIGQVLDLMVVEGVSRRSAIIRVCGFDQLRRIEMKMAAVPRLHGTEGSGAMSIDEGILHVPLLRRISDTSAFDYIEAAMSEGICVTFGDVRSLAAAKREDVLVMSFMANPIDRGTPHRSNTLNPFAGPFPDLGIVLD